MRLSLRQLKKLIVEEMKGVDERTNDSLDAQIDRFLLEYESQAKHAKTEVRDFRALVRRFLTEAEDDEKGGDKNAEQKEAKASIDDIDVNTFCDSVMRLIQNYDNLLEVKNTLLRRATKFLAKQYDDEVISAFKASCRENHGIEVGRSENDIELDYFQPPPAKGAGTEG